MTQLQEFRIGNLIHCKTDRGIKVGRIDSLQEITKNSYFVSVKTSDNIDYRGKVSAEYNCIEPIPITEELLLKIGFKKDRNDYFNYSKYNDELSIRFTSNYTTIEYANLFHCPEDVTETNYCSSLEFPNSICVHTLQNIWYLLTGNELEIKL